MIIVIRLSRILSSLLFPHHHQMMISSHLGKDMLKEIGLVSNPMNREM
jgi:hypothetical protein